MAFAHRSLLLILLCILSFPDNALPKSVTHRTRKLASGIVIESYHPPSSYETFGPGLDHPLSRRANTTLAESAIAILQQRLGFKNYTMHLHATHEGDVARYAYFKQTINDIPVANAVANVALNKANKLVAIGSSFVHNPKANSAAPLIPIGQAIATAESALNGSFEAINFPQPELEYLVKGDSSLALVHVFQVRNGGSGSWYEAYVDAHTCEILSVTDFVAQATYRVLPITKQILTQGFGDLVDPYDIEASPLGWHNDGKTLSNDTAGNNAISFNIIQADVVTESASNLTFLFTQDPTLDPTVTVNLDAARVNAFYLVNSVHDIAYRYGFTESAFNFQTDNFGLGGKGNDRITISVQDGGGVNNAEFTTLPDGQNGQMRMFIWDYTVPRRDSDLENDIVVHEYTHGITNRMTGGGTATCLQTLEAGGLGEGWSDAMAEWSEHTDANITDYVIGPYVTNNTAGLRTYPYSTSNVTNPLRYSSVAKFNEVHQIGEVWANMLHNIYAALIQQHGFSQTARTDPTGTEGNIVFLHLFIDALPLQPCNPTFLSARDAWIQADVTRYGGENKCILWRSFASKGLGMNASNYTDDATVPTGC